MPSIETHGLTKHYGDDIVAVEDLNLTVETDEVFGFLGPNGAGKSTTIDLLLGFTPSTAGHATGLGQRVTGERTAVRRDIGVLPEGRSRRY
jgi:ABC-2 type transport system ATP-binding protein